jgi:toxin-antitoxin system PIN domain toxin
MIIPDANLLIYAYDEKSSHHRKANEWWSNVLSSSRPVGIPWVVFLAFTRLMTHPQICESPLSVAEVRGITLDWWDYPHLRLLTFSEGSVGRFFDLLEEAGCGGNLSTDALIALHALEHSATIYSNDRDFGRFQAVKWINPLT